MSACAIRYDSSGFGEKVDSGTATAPASATPNRHATASGRFPMSTPTRVPFPTPLASNALAMRRAWRCRSE